jgi:hypothetical protein
MQQAGLCAVCHREPRGFGWFNASVSVGNPERDRSYRQLCSKLCQDLCHGRRGMIDPNPNERAAMAHGGAMAGEYLDSLGKTDLARLSVEEWHTLIEVIVTGYCDHLRDLAAKDRARLDCMIPEVPF